MLYTKKQLKRFKSSSRKANRLLGLKRKKKNKKIPIKYKGKGGYKEYLKTKHWKSFKIWYYKNYSKTCFCCNGDGKELHHIRYDNLFRESEKDVVCVCRECHEEIHTMILNEKDVNLKNAHNVLKSLNYLKI